MLPEAKCQPPSKSPTPSFSGVPAHSRLDFSQVLITALILMKLLQKMNFLLNEQSLVLG